MRVKVYLNIVILLLFTLCQSCNNGSKEKQYIDTACPLSDSALQILGKSSIDTINIFFDASGSMSGFLPSSKQSNEFQILIPDIISRLNTEFHDRVIFYPIYDSSKIKKIEIEEASRQILYGKLTHSNSDTYLPKMLTTIYNGYFKKGAINIFISDCIYSPNEREKKQTGQVTTEIRDQISKYTNEYFTTTYLLTSKYNQIPQSPYYILLFGSPENNHVIEKTIEKSIKSNNQYYEQANFGLKYNLPYYSILPYTNNSPKWLANPCNTSTDVFENIKLENWNPDTDTLRFWLGINLEKFPDYIKTQKYLDSNLILSINNGKSKILSIIDKKPTDTENDDMIIANKSTHFIQIQASDLLDKNIIAELKLQYRKPDWFIKYDQNINDSNSDKTFGLNKLMNGFYEAYYNNESQFFFSNLKILISK